MAKSIAKPIPPAVPDKSKRVSMAQHTEDTQSQSKYLNLPNASVISDRRDFQETSELIREGLELTKESKVIEERLASVKLRLKELSAKYNLLDGIRYGSAGFTLTYSNRSTLDKSMLIENGVTVEQIEASQKVSLVTTLKCVDIPG